MDIDEATARAIAEAQGRRYRGKAVDYSKETVIEEVEAPKKRQKKKPAANNLLVNKKKAAAAPKKQSNRWREESSDGDDFDDDDSDSDDSGGFGQKRKASKKKKGAKAARKTDRGGAGGRSKYQELSENDDDLCDSDEEAAALAARYRNNPEAFVQEPTAGQSMYEKLLSQREVDEPSAGPGAPPSYRMEYLAKLRGLYAPRTASLPRACAPCSPSCVCFGGRGEIGITRSPAGPPAAATRTHARARTTYKNTTHPSLSPHTSLPPLLPSQVVHAL